LRSYWDIQDKGRTWKHWRDVTQNGLQRGIQRLFIYLFKVYFKILLVAQTLEHWMLG